LQRELSGSELLSRFHVEASLSRFVSLDEAQNQAAAELGLPV
jgi:hypothetical protein